MSVSRRTFFHRVTGRPGSALGVPQSSSPTPPIVIGDRGQDGARGTDRKMIAPPIPLDAGTFGALALRGRASEIFGALDHSCSQHFLRADRCWEELYDLAGPLYYRLKPRDRLALQGKLFEGFPRSSALASFAYWLAEVDLSSEPGNIPDLTHAVPFSRWAFGESATGIKVVATSAPASVSRPLRLRGHRPRNGHDSAHHLPAGAMLGAACLCACAFQRGALQLEQRVARLAMGPLGWSSLWSSAQELVFGGLSAILRWNATGQSIWLAQIAARGYFVTGLDTDGTLVFQAVGPVTTRRKA
jgi:hypothetical protein